MGGLIDLPELEVIEKGCPSLEARAFKDIIGGTRAIIDSVHHVEVTPHNVDFIRGKERFQRLQLEHTERREIPRGEIKVGTGEGRPCHTREVFGVKIKY
jgi:hypothetical protein